MISLELKSNTAQFAFGGKFEGNISGHQSGRFYLFIIQQSIIVEHKLTQAYVYVLHMNMKSLKKKLLLIFLQLHINNGIVRKKIFY